MKTLKQLFFVLVIAFTATAMVQTSALPDKTIIIKNPAAENLATYLSSTSSLNFYIYKPGTEAEITKLVKTISQQKEVQSFAKGTTNGDYHEFNLVLKSAKDKKWYVALFKKAGINNIKINNQSATTLEKL